MNKKLLDNYDKMVVKDKVAVIHCAFGDTPHTVAFVHVDKDLLETQKCDKAFMLTNSIDNAWWKNDDVTPMDFVINILVSIFKHSTDTAKDLTLKI